jgi:GINS complex subunit 4
MADISDILNGLSHDYDPFSDDHYDSSSGTHSGQADLQALTRAWVNERGAAELLPYVPSAHLPLIVSYNYIVLRLI